MPRFTDQWVQDRTMFDYVNGGQCACCGFPHLFAPGGLEGMIHAMSDLETDTATQEINAAKASPWPPDMRDQIWSDRLLLRFKMKKEMKAYRSFLEEVVIKNHNGGDEQRAISENNNDCDEKIIDINNAIPILQQFCTDTLSIKQLRSIFQLPRSELTEVLKAKYKICSAYAILFCGVVEQVANFGRTGYGVDARCNNGDDTTEEIFEDELKFEKVGPGFCLKLATKTNNCNGVGGGDDDGWEVNEDVLNKFLQRMISLAGPILLARAAKVSHDNSNESDDDDDGEADGDNISGSEIQPGTNVPSFRSDRRVARLMIARYWADRLMEKYNEVQKKKKEDEVEEEVEGQQ